MLLCYRFIHFDDRIADLETGLDGRDKELCKPLLQLFHKTKTYDKVKDVLTNFLNKKNRRKKSTAIEIVVNLIAKRGTTKLCMREIWDVIRGLVPEVHPGITGFSPADKPGEYRTEGCY